VDLLYFEDFPVGEVVEFGDRVVMAEEIVEFARLAVGQNRIERRTLPMLLRTRAGRNGNRVAHPGVH